MCEHNLGWRSGRFLRRSPAWLPLKAARSVRHRADVWRERSRHPGRRWLVAALSLIAISPNLVTAEDLRMPISPIWGVPEVGALPDDTYARLVRRGRELITATYAHIGPEVADTAKRYAGNNLACRNCHLEAGTKRFGTWRQTAGGEGGRKGLHPRGQHRGHVRRHGTGLRLGG